MPEISYSALKKALAEITADTLAPVVLIFGEEYLCKKALNGLLDRIFPADERAFGYETFDGLERSVHEVLDAVNTYPFMSTGKTVGYLDAKIFSSAKGDGKRLQQVKAAYDKNDVKKAARLLIGVLQENNLSFDAFGENERKTLTGAGDGEGEPLDWLDAVVAAGREEGLTVPPPQDHAAAVLKAVEKGFPKGNRLIIVTDSADKRRNLYKTIKRTGMIIDCSMPAGNRKADREQQMDMCRATVDSVIMAAGKKIASDAFTLLIERIGSDLRLLAGNTEKLVDYVGGRDLIEKDDVLAVAQKTKTDPIYEFTGALADRRADHAFACLASLLDAGMAPLQILAAMINQFRRLLMLKDFAESRIGSNWRRDMPYFQFRDLVFPAIQSYDERSSDQLIAWETESRREEGRQRRKKKMSSDLFISGKSKSPYPVYQNLLKCENFSRKELVDALMTLQQADNRLKTTGQSSRMLIEAAIVKITGLR